MIDAAGSLYIGGADATISILDPNTYQGEVHRHYEWNASSQTVNNITKQRIMCITWLITPPNLAFLPKAITGVSLTSGSIRGSSAIIILSRIKHSWSVQTDGYTIIIKTPTIAMQFLRCLVTSKVMTALPTMPFLLRRCTTNAYLPGRSDGNK